MKNTTIPKTYPPITYLPDALLAVCQLDTKQGVRMEASVGLLALFNSKMTAGEMVGVIAQLRKLSNQLTRQLAKHCGVCDNCEESADGIPEDWIADCDLCDDLLNPHFDIHVPDYLCDEAGIPVDAKLTGEGDEETGEITLREADWKSDLSDVPDFLLGELLNVGICLPKLDEAMRMEYTIHADE